MIKLGLVSITFRKLSYLEVIQLVTEAGLEGIEWGGDVHVPHGDLEKAELVGKSTREAGLSVTSYGSYHRFDSDNSDFDTVLETAIKLSAPVIRVWAGRKSPGECSAEYYSKLVTDIQTASDKCRIYGIKLGLEFHRNTYTQEYHSTLKLIQDVGRSNLYTYWQPPVNSRVEDNIQGIKSIKESLLWTHVFHWGATNKERFLLKSGLAHWREYFQTIRDIDGDRWALIEFVKDDLIENFFNDAATLKSL